MSIWKGTCTSSGCWHLQPPWARDAANLSPAWDGHFDTIHESLLWRSHCWSRCILAKWQPSPPPSSYRGRSDTLSHKRTLVSFHCCMVLEHTATNGGGACGDDCCCRQRQLHGWTHQWLCFCAISVDMPTRDRLSTPARQSWALLISACWHLCACCSSLQHAPRTVSIARTMMSICWRWHQKRRFRTITVCDQECSMVLRSVKSDKNSGFPIEYLLEQKQITSWAKNNCLNKCRTVHDGNWSCSGRR